MVLKIIIRWRSSEANHRGAIEWAGKNPTMDDWPLTSHYRVVAGAAGGPPADERDDDLGRMN